MLLDIIGGGSGLGNIGGVFFACCPSFLRIALSNPSECHAMADFYVLSMKDGNA